MAKKKSEVTIRSSAAEYLTYIAATGDTVESIEIRYEDENIWLTQKMMAVLYDVDVRTINYHIKKIFEDRELQENSVIRKFRITASDGKEYNTNHYSVQMIIAVGFKVNSDRAVQFRKWVNMITSEYKPTGDQPEAIKALVDGFKEGNQFQTLLGVTGSGKTFTMANVIEQLNKPILIIAHNKTLAAQLYGEFKEFFPENAVEYFAY